MFVSVIELSPGSTLIELAVIIRRLTYDQCLEPWKKVAEIILSPWMFHFETVIKMDFCVLLSHPDRLLNHRAQSFQ